LESSILRRKFEVSSAEITENFYSTRLKSIFQKITDIVDKTASFVARNGFEFEKRIHQSEKGNKKFSFLNPGDPYHAYYQHKVQNIKEGVSAEKQSAQSAIPGLQKLSISQKQQELLKQATEQQFQPKDPPPEFEFIADPPSISALDL
jgi:splicing factor 3A subunit 1